MGQRCDTVLHALMPSSKQSSRKERTDPEAMTSTKQRWVRRDKKKRRRMAVHGRTTKRLAAHLQAFIRNTPFKPRRRFKERAGTLRPR